MKKFAIATAVALSTVFVTPAFADDEGQFIDQIQSYLEISEKFVALANRQDAAVFFAVEGIVEIYEARGEKANAAAALKEILEKYPDNRPARNIIRFKLRDVYRETGKADLALAELEAVIEENR